MEIIAVEKYGKFETPLRNIRASIDEGAGTFDLIPEEIRDHFDIEEDDEALRKVLEGAKLVVEAKNLLRVDFAPIMAIAADMDVGDLFNEIHENWDKAPKIKNKQSYYPFLEIRNSPWREKLQDWQGGDNPKIKHYRLISAANSFDILGELDGANWKPNKWYEGPSDSSST